MSASNEDDTERPKKLRLSDLNQFVVSEEAIVLRARPVLSHLPPDVWLVIASHLHPEISFKDVEEHSGTRSGSMPYVYRERFDALRALSQTCRTLRARFLPLAWEHVEACLWADTSIPANHYLSYILKRQCHGLSRYPELASYVKTMTISLRHSNQHPVLKRAHLPRCLGSLPNLHTLQIVSCSFSTAVLEETFQDQNYASIKTIVLPVNAYPIIESCLALKNVHVVPGRHLSMYYWKQLLLTVASNCPYIEVLTGLNPMTHRDIKEVTRESPYAKRIEELLALSSP